MPVIVPFLGPRLIFGGIPAQKDRTGANQSRGFDECRENAQKLRVREINCFGRALFPRLLRKAPPLWNDAIGGAGRLTWGHPPYPPPGASDRTRIWAPGTELWRRSRQALALWSSRLFGGLVGQVSYLDVCWGVFTPSGVVWECGNRVAAPTLLVRLWPYGHASRAFTTHNMALVTVNNACISIVCAVNHDSRRWLAGRSVAALVS